jgi:hypothetical protein
VIGRLNAGFVCTSAIIDDLEKRAKAGDGLAKELAAQWEYPVEMLFCTPDGRVVSKMNSFKDFPGVHPDVSAPPHKGSQPAPTDERAHAHSFLKNLAEHFGNP